ncbi:MULTISPECIES: DUF6327 family protein [Bizionia]|uniref:Glutaminyl-tRNA synthetase n=1 Tax=Bizionia algoritergicola TaxID=291187 RepID=A0A5D0QSQ2_9FLAO|nr:MULTISPECIES: DUF6327 family protein [Bizionia]OBX21143.1 hypothetical protein BAA08_13900 [Bizionia sp. APA-3]TYB71721.1 hypothetical protein ES675_14365 [Bizionia algoritergicola]
MKNYQSFTDIESDLKRLDLERKIAFEEMKLLKTEFKEDLKPSNWINTLLNVAGKYGLYMVMKRFLK